MGAWEASEKIRRTAETKADLEERAAANLRSLGLTEAGAAAGAARAVADGRVGRVPGSEDLSWSKRGIIAPAYNENGARRWLDDRADKGAPFCVGMPASRRVGPDAEAEAAKQRKAVATGFRLTR